LYIEAGCQHKHYWEFLKMGLTASVGDAKAYTKSEHTKLDPVPMAAKGEDTHILVQECHCTDTVTRTWYTMDVTGEFTGKPGGIAGLDALIRYTWEISKGGGMFIQKTGGAGPTTEVGQQAIYQPPEIEAIYPDPRATLDVNIRVVCNHDDPSKLPYHGPVELGLHLRIIKMAKDKYTYEYWPAEPVDMTNPVNLPGTRGYCTNIGTWMQGSAIEGVIEGPKECEPGDYVRLKLKADDTDRIDMQCIPGGPCKRPDNHVLPMSDKLAYEWKSTTGKFTKTPTSSAPEIVWEAPKEEGIAELEVRIYDTKKEFSDEDLVLGYRIEVKKKSTPQPSIGEKKPGDKKDEKKEDKKGETKKGEDKKGGPAPASWEKSIK
jgi:hypothetical protein